MEEATPTPGQEAPQAAQAPVTPFGPQTDPVVDEAALRAGLEALKDVRLEVTALLGDAAMPIEQFLKLGRGAIIELRQRKDAMMRICVNGYALALGEITVVEDRIGVTVKRTNL